MDKHPVTGNKDNGRSEMNREEIHNNTPVQLHNRNRPGKVIFIPPPGG